jgi:hypothetical protein
MPDPPVPLDFIVFASQKSASTWFCRCLDEHPEIAIGYPYEKRFLREREGWVEREKNPQFLDDWEAYRDQFPDKEDHQLRGDGDVELYYNESGPDVVEKFYPDVKLIAILRDPVARIRSEYAYRVRDPKVEEGTLEEYIDESLTIDRSSYAKQLDPWFDRFGEDQILGLPWTELGEEGEDLLEEAFAFLDVDPTVEPPSLTERVNPHREKQAWFQALESVARGLRRLGLGPLMDLVNRVGVGPAVREVGDPPADKPEMPPEIEAELRRELADDIDQLETMIGKDLSAWKPEPEA